MGWQLRSRRLTRQAVCVVLKAGTATSRTRCPSSPAGTGGRQAPAPLRLRARPGPGLTRDHLGLEAGRAAAEVDVRALGEDEGIRLVEGVAGCGGGGEEGNPSPQPPTGRSEPRSPPLGAARRCPPLTQGVRRRGADVSRPQRPLQDLQVVVHAAVLEDVTDVLPRRPQKPTFWGKEGQPRARCDLSPHPLVPGGCHSPAGTLVPT